MAVLVHWLALSSVHSILGKAFLYVLGFFSVGYVGYPADTLDLLPEEKKLVAIAILGTISYLLVLALILARQFL